MYIIFSKWGGGGGGSGDGELGEVPLVLWEWGRGAGRKYVCPLFLSEKKKQMCMMKRMDSDVNTVSEITPTFLV